MQITNDLNYSTINMQDLLRWFTLTNPIKQYIIPQTTTYRPTLISYQVYGTIQFYPFIMIFNNIQNLTTLTAGSIIYYPDVNDIYSFIYSQELRYQEE